MAHLAKQIHHRNEITQACLTDAVTNCRHCRPTLETYITAVGIQRVCNATFVQCTFLHQWIFWRWFASYRNSSISCGICESSQQRLSQENSLQLASRRWRSFCQITLTSCMALCLGLPGWADTKRINHSGFCRSRNDVGTVASAGPYASHLHLVPDR